MIGYFNYFSDRSSRCDRAGQSPSFSLGTPLTLTHFQPVYVEPL
ncbi:MAG: hypothetical protein ACOYME_02270 [Prochlorotrichaceae cyanobacterium]